jgi:tetratricopeptide (TPR) repeat protein
MPDVFKSAIAMMGAWVLLGAVTAGESGGAEKSFENYRAKVEARIEEQQSAIQKDPENATAHFQLGLAYMALGRHGEEIAAYKQAIKLKPNFTEAHYNLGVAYDLIGNEVLAIFHTRKALHGYTLERNHRGIRKSQRALRRLNEKYGEP